MEDSLELKIPEQNLKTYLAEIRHIKNIDKSTYLKAKDNKAKTSEL